ncbi:hypothetical protein [Alcanivorax sp. NBRC 102024]|uniref:hypothetical protein n=1 Tax=Alcanivorax sp. NBRC 102024 TaxID=1113895 RepID=UPI000789C20B|nr:hypothetical protein [Alcanivorax sp. NBRC 102024]
MLGKWFGQRKVPPRPQFIARQELHTLDLERYTTVYAYGCSSQVSMLIWRSNTLCYNRMLTANPASPQEGELFIALPNLQDSHLQPLLRQLAALDPLDEQRLCVPLTITPLKTLHRRWLALRNKTLGY